MSKPIALCSFSGGKDSCFALWQAQRHGELDLRTPMGQTEEYFQALKLRKVPTAMVRFQNEYHGTSSMPSNFLRTALYLHHWFGKWKRSDQKAEAEKKAEPGSTH